jgi:hypothetical protein
MKLERFGTNLDLSSEGGCPGDEFIDLKGSYY